MRLYFNTIFHAFIGFLLTVPPGFAQRQDVKFQHLSVEEGLSQITVYAVAQDYKGFMWFGTKDGLNKFDGYQLTVYKNVPFEANSLSDNVVQTLYADSLATLWIGTKGGLNKLDLITERFSRYVHDPQNPRSLSNDYVWTICRDRSGALWIGTDGGGLNRFDPQTEEFIHYQNDPNDAHSLSNDQIRAVHQDRSGTLWIGTLNGLNKFDPATSSFVRYQYDPADPRSLSNNVVMDILEDTMGTLWIGTLGGGLNVYEPATGKFARYRHDPKQPNSLSDDRVSAIWQDSRRSGTLWIGTLGGGLNRFHRETGTFTCYKNDAINPGSLSHDAIWSIYEDRSGSLWIGTAGGGLNKLAPRKKFNHYGAAANDPHGLNNPFVRALLVDHQDMVWVGTYGGGLNKLDRRTGAFMVYKNDPSNPASLSHNVVWSIYEDRNNTLWVGTRKGLNRFDRRAGSFKQIKSDPDDSRYLSDYDISTIYEDSKGTLWIGTFNGGLNKFDRVTLQVERHQNNPADSTSLSHNSIFCIVEDRGGALWIGTDGGGLNKFDRQTGRSKRFLNDPRNPRSLSHNSVRSIYEDPSGALWIGTSQGLNKLDPQTGDFIQYFEKDGLPNAVIYGVLGDERGNLWLSTNNGIARFNEHLPDGKRCQNFDANDGLQSAEFNTGAYHKSKSGEMFFGGVNGFNCFFPDEIQSNPYVPPVALTAFRKFGEMVELDTAIYELDRLDLSYRENFFSFEFAALDYAAPEKNRYAYKLDGFDEQWIDAGARRFASYTNLDGGSYVFRVKGSNSDGVWNEAGARINVRIIPPYWKTAWFRILLLALLAGIIAMAYHARVKQLKREKQAQESFSRRLIDLQEKERKRIAAELHDSFGQNLLIIRNGLQSLLASLSGQKASLSEVNQLSEIALQAINEVREISYDLHPHQLDRLGLKKAIESVIQKFSRAGGVKWTAEIGDIEGLLPKNAEINVYRIIQEGLSNVIKHAGAHEAIVRVKQQQKRLKILIMDDGQGFDQNVHPAAANHQGFGLANISERAKMLNGKMLLKSAPGKGTTLDVQIPI
jgi:signal transduction histidine kinase/ligand-binding sensor domain-containing protein